MKYLTVSFVLVGFYSLIGLSVYFTNSAWPLLALILTPRIRVKKDG